MKRCFVLCFTALLLTSSLAIGQGDPQGVLDSLYIECPPNYTEDSLIIHVRFFSDNANTNTIVAFGLPLLISVSDSALLSVDTTTARTFQGSIVSSFTIKSVDIDSCCGGSANPAESPVHLVIGAIHFGNGVSGDGLFATIKLRFKYSPWTVYICIDTLSTATLHPSLVTEAAVEFTPGWHVPLLCGLNDNCPTNGIVRDVDGPSSLPTQYMLSQNVPNPFNQKTSIQFSVPRTSHVKLEILDILGRKVRSLVNENLIAGYKQVTWDGRNENGEEVASGVYFYRIKSVDFGTTKRMVLLK